MQKPTREQLESESKDRLINMVVELAEINDHLKAESEDYVKTIEDMEFKLRKQSDQISKLMAQCILPINGGDNNNNWAAGKTFRIVYTDSLREPTRPIIYAGVLDFVLNSAMDDRGNIRMFKERYRRHFRIRVGFDMKNAVFIPLNKHRPAHPNIGSFICLGDTNISEFMVPENWTEQGMSRLWDKYKKQFAAVLSTANPAGGFTDREYNDVEFEDGEATVWSKCNRCSNTTQLCGRCGNCGEHCRCMTCKSCGELVDEGEVCCECGNCNECGHDTDCSDHRFECERCGELFASADELIRDCGMCVDCHNDSGHGYCFACDTHVTEGEGHDCNVCGELFCDSCVLYDEEDPDWGPVCRHCASDASNNRSNETTPSNDSVWHV